MADIDTLVKGLAYFKAVGPLYYFRAISCIVLSLIAIKVDNPKFQAAFAGFAVLCEITFIVTAQLTMG